MNVVKKSKKLRGYQVGMKRYRWAQCDIKLVITNIDLILSYIIRININDHTKKDVVNNLLLC